MSIALITNAGDIIVDLFTTECPKSCENFLKLAKYKYYDGLIFHRVVKKSWIISGDPLLSGKGGNSIFGLIQNSSIGIIDEHPILYEHQSGSKAFIGFTNRGIPNSNQSQFFLSTESFSTISKNHTVFGYVVKGIEIIQFISNSYLDTQNRPLENFRIHSALVVDDPFPDPTGFETLIPLPKRFSIINSKRVWTLGSDRVEYSNEKSKTNEENQLIPDKTSQIEKKLLSLLDQNAHSIKKTAEILSRLETLKTGRSLFITRLNPKTTSRGLHDVLSTIVPITSCHISINPDTKASRCFAFVHTQFPQDASVLFQLAQTHPISIDNCFIVIQQSYAHKLVRSARTTRSLPDGDEKVNSPSKQRLQLVHTPKKKSPKKIVHSVTGYHLQEEFLKE